MDCYSILDYLLLVLIITKIQNLGALLVLIGTLVIYIGGGWVNVSRLFILITVDFISILLIQENLEEVVKLKNNTKSLMSRINFPKD